MRDPLSRIVTALADITGELTRLRDAVEAGKHVTTLHLDVDGWDALCKGVALLDDAALKHRIVFHFWEVQALARLHTQYNWTGNPFDENVENQVWRGHQQEDLVGRAIKLRLKSEILRRDILTYLDRPPV